MRCVAGGDRTGPTAVSGQTVMESLAKVRLVAVGDIALNGGYEELARKGRAQEVLSAVTPLLQEADLTLGNLEGPFTERPPVSPPWRHCMRGHPSYASLLRAAGFNVLNLANNHIMDYGWDAVAETIERATAAGIRVFGVGKDLATARQALQVTVNGLKVSFLGYCGVAVRNPLYAAANQPGVAPASPAQIMQDIAAARGECDFLVVCMHWGQEHVGYPSPANRRLARDMIAAGASLIIGHHPHVLQGAELLPGGLVAYSLGNFTFADEDWVGANRDGRSFVMPMRLSEAARRTAVLKVDVADDARILTHELIPAYLGADLRVTPDLRPERARELRESSGDLSRPGYTFFWWATMLKSRARAVARQQSAATAVWRRLHRLRPRHLRGVLQILGREWEQLRGVK